MLRRLVPAVGLSACGAIVIGLMLIGAGCSKSSGKPRFAVIPKGTTHMHWKSVEAGARQAADEFGVEIVWKGPLREDDRAEQISLVEQFVAEGVSGIAVAPLDDTALTKPVKAAASRNIPVVIFDSSLKADAGKDFIAFVGTDNKKGGRMAGDELAKILDGKGKVVMIRYSEGSASTAEREAGFMEAMTANPGIQVISSDQYAGATVDTAKVKSENMLDTLRQADGIYTPNESSTQGTLLTLRQAGLLKGEGRKKFVGFDASPALVDAIEAGDLDAVVAQNPRKMGYDTVKALADKLAGRTVQVSQDTGATLVSKATLSTPDVKKLLNR